MHGKVFNTTEDKVGYGKQLGKVSINRHWNKIATGAEVTAGTEQAGA